MRHIQKYSITNLEIFKSGLLELANSPLKITHTEINSSVAAYETICFLESNHWQGKYDCMMGLGVIEEIYGDISSFEELKTFYELKKDWLFGYFSYDLKNELEKLSSDNMDRIQFPKLHFFQPRYVFLIEKLALTILYLEKYDNKESVDLVYKQLNMLPLFQPVGDMCDYPPLEGTGGGVKSRITKEEYINTIKKIKQNIHAGDIYEMNFCQEFYQEDMRVNPTDIFLKLNEISQAPFSAFYRLKDKYLMCASPERFLKKDEKKITSQPIKGTIKRGQTVAEDEDLKHQLFHDTKERSENVMIVDLVRNDLSRSAARGSVKVEELFGIYTFRQVHQMISTVSSELKEDVHFIDAIKFAFPMGSMTGAPKVKSMELIEKYESTRRGLYSGAVGYITPEGDFDFNVVIRSILYNAIDNYLSFMVGSAITDKADPEKEYQECLLKAKAMLDVIYKFAHNT